MAKHKYNFDEPKIARFIKEGRGQGHGKDFKPWLTIQDVPSIGLSSRKHSFKTGRGHHLLSNNETGLFLLLNWSNSVVDIREQFPLDRDVTRQIAAEMGVDHPIDSQTRIDIVMTTDFLVDFRTDKGIKHIVRSVKPYAELSDPRTIEKQEIDRRYWSNFENHEWGLVTDIDLPKQRIKTLHWLHEMQSLEHLVVPYPGYWSDRCNQLLSALQQTNDVTIKQFFEQLEMKHGFAIGEGLTAYRHLAATKKIIIDIDKPFNMKAPVLEITITEQANETTRRHA